MDTTHIKEVWSDNLDHEFAFIHDIIDKYHYVSMDTEYPGIVERAPPNTFNTRQEHNFWMLRANVNILKLIQLGLTLSDENGTLPTCEQGKRYVWQFNFCEFNPEEDRHARESIELLRNSGIDFVKNREKGIDVKRFGELMISSGLVSNGEVQWVTFQGMYDFAYLLKILTGKSLPNTWKEFKELLNTFFPIAYDIKYLIRVDSGLHGGLSKLGQMLDVKRVGNSHQAGSDSLLTCGIFFKLKHSRSNFPDVRCAGMLYTLDP